MRKRKAFKPFAFLAAVAPALFPREAGSETLIQASQTTPVVTSVVGDDVRVTSAGSINLTAPGVAVTVDSAHDFTNQGAVTIVDSNNSTAVLLNGGADRNFTNEGVISNLENYDYDDIDDDGDLDGPFANGFNRYGVRVAGGTPFVGDIEQTTAGQIAVEGEDSYGVAIEGAGVDGNIDLRGSVSVIGDRSIGVRTTGVVNGNLTVGTTSARGEDSVGVSIENQVNGGVVVAGAVTANGYRFQARPADDIIADLDADDLLQGGPAMQVLGNVTGGVFVNNTPIDASTSDNDEDDDGLIDSTESTGSLQAFGSTPALQIGDSGGPAITIGNVSGLSGYTYGLVNDSTISTVALLDGRRSLGVRVENADLTGGIRNRGTILGGSFDEDGIAVSLGANAIVPELNNSGSITGISNSDLGGFNAYGVQVELNANVPLLRNSGTISAQRFGEAGDAVAIYDGSDTLRLIENSGNINATRILTDDADDLDDADVDPNNEVSTGNEIAIDLSEQLIGSTIRQVAPVSSTAAAPSITGDILFGTGSDILDVQAGRVNSDIDFNTGNDQLLISGGGIVEGVLSNSGVLDIDVTDGRLNLSNLGALSATTLLLDADGVLELQLDPLAAQNGSLNLSGNADFVSGSAIDVILRTPVITSQTFNLITAGSISGPANVSLDQSPYLYEATPTVTATTVDLELTRRTAAQLGLNANQSAFYENFFTAALGDTGVMTSLLGLGTQQTFTDGFDQFLPNATGAQVEFAATRTQAMTSQLFSRYLGPVQKNREVYAWGHELTYSRDREQTGTGQGFDGFGFGFAAGIDGPMGKSGYKGYGLSFASDEINEKTGADRPFTVSSLELMGHAVQPLGKVLLGGRLAVGYDQYKSQRRVDLDPDLNAPSLLRESEAEWSGARLSGSLRAALPLEAGWLRIRPEVGVDAVSLWEQDYEEEGGGAGIDLAVDARQSLRANASATLNVGSQFANRGFVFNPEVMVGVRQPLANDGYETSARFVSSPGTFTLVGDTVDETAFIAGAALTVDGQIGSLRLEAQGEQADGDTAVSGRVVLRLTF